MIRLIGVVNGVEVAFTFSPPNTFTATIPAIIKGTYYVHLKAIDDAGNETNYMNLHVMINFDTLSFKILDNTYNVDVDDIDDNHLEVSSDYLSKDIQSEFTYSLYTSCIFKELMLDANI